MEGVFCSPDRPRIPETLFHEGQLAPPNGCSLGEDEQPRGIRIPAQSTEVEQITVERIRAGIDPGSAADVGAGHGIWGLTCENAEGRPDGRVSRR